MDYSLLGKRIREERRKLDLTQEQLAEDVNVSYPHIGQVERGESGISLEALIAISNRLGVTVDYLLSDYIENEDEYLRQLWVRLVKNRSEKEQDMIINVVKAIISGLD
ncbi:MAG: helix-turn-helix domain-containing protein [Defluviitaleaceae bacterium]|nr:helix-turn-helix domain-containing protein [Defluviitaleaceae bacterium]MCL2262066.1 helix-turn-helix domain-containing protein [Defluviitaleaceae bacterium]